MNSHQAVPATEREELWQRIVQGLGVIPLSGVVQGLLVPSYLSPLTQRRASSQPCNTPGHLNTGSGPSNMSQALHNYFLDASPFSTSLPRVNRCAFLPLSHSEALRCAPRGLCRADAVWHCPQKWHRCLAALSLLFLRQLSSLVAATSLSLNPLSQMVAAGQCQASQRSWA